MQRVSQWGPAAELTNMWFCLLSVTDSDLNFVLVAKQCFEFSHKFCNFSWIFVFYHFKV